MGLALTGGGKEGMWVLWVWGLGSGGLGYVGSRLRDWDYGFGG